ncbi:Uncharacterized protein EJ110_NYTH44984 [Nymphaea thermarum]|nr:Uncharacterized protein EJ110_NYTH44984 [Nymphaea thermarum]
MERLMKKYQSKYKRAREEMDRWEQLQSLFLTQFGNASAIIGRLPVLQDPNNFGTLSGNPDIKKELLAKQLESFEMNYSALLGTMKEFLLIVKALEKISQDAYFLLKEECKKVSSEQMEARVEAGPSIMHCLEGLKTIHEMHLFEYNLKSSVVLALNWNSSPGDLTAFSHLLADQPNIPGVQVQLIYNKIFMDGVDQ